MKKFFLILFIVLISINLSYSYKGYNSSYSNFSLGSNGWCANYPITFKVYNQTQYLEKNTIKSNLCLVNQTPAKNNCKVFQTLSPNVKVYGGPFDSFPTIFDGKANLNSDFTVNFSRPGPYLIELSGLSTFNDYYEPLFEVSTCKFLSNLELSTQKSVLFNQSYSYGGILVDINNTDINSSKNISVSVFNNFSDINSSVLNESIKIFEINSSSSNFSQVKITVPLVFVNSSNLKLYKLDSTSNSWVNSNSYQIMGKNLILSSSGFGIYSVVETIPKIVEKIIVNETKMVVNDSMAQNNISNSSIVKAITKKPSSSSSSYIWYILIGLILALGIFYFIYKNNNKTIYHNSVDSKTNTSSDVEVLSTYTQIYEHTKDYVKQYKSEFSKDQIYRSLKEANISKDIIDKVFSEEF